MSVVICSLYERMNFSGGLPVRTGEFHKTEFDPSVCYVHRFAIHDGAGNYFLLADPHPVRLHVSDAERRKAALAKLTIEDMKVLGIKP